MTSLPNPAGRPRSFDETDALEKVMTVFWDSGYDATNYPALEAATGLHRQSLRYAFGDKAALFARVIEHYAERKVGGVVATLNRPQAALENIRAVFATWVQDANHPSHRGCLMVNALAELGGEAPAAVAAIHRASQRLAEGFTHAFRAAQQAGVVRADQPPEVLAHLALALGDGFMVHARSGAVSRFAEAAFAAFLKQITIQTDDG